MQENGWSDEIISVVIELPLHEFQTPNVKKLHKSKNPNIQSGRKSKYSDAFALQIYSADCEGMSIDEISMKFGIPRGSVKFLVLKGGSSKVKVSPTLNIDPCVRRISPSISNDGLIVLMQQNGWCDDIISTVMERSYQEGIHNKVESSNVRKRKSKYSDELIQQIYSAKSAGMSVVEIANEFSLNYQAIKYLLQKAKSSDHNAPLTPKIDGRIRFLYLNGWKTDDIALVMDITEMEVVGSLVDMSFDEDVEVAKGVRGKPLLKPDLYEAEMLNFVRESKEHAMTTHELPSHFGVPIGSVPSMLSKLDPIAPIEPKHSTPSNRNIPVVKIKNISENGMKECNDATQNLVGSLPSIKIKGD
jgi:hypothetical protein